MDKLYRKVKCPDCPWNGIPLNQNAAMTPCHNCNSTGYIYEPVDEPDKEGEPLDLLDPEQSEEYIVGIEDAHKKAAGSKLTFDSNLLPRSEPPADRDKDILTEEEIKAQLLESGFLVSYAENLSEEELVWWKGMCQEQIDKLKRLGMLKTEPPADRVFNSIFSMIDKALHQIPYSEIYSLTKEIYSLFEPKGDEKLREEVAFLSYQLHYRHYWKREVYRMNWNNKPGWEKAQYYEVASQILLLIAGREK